MESESPKNQRAERILNFGCAVLVAIPFVCIIVFVVSQNLNRRPPRDMTITDSSEPFQVALAFAYSLPYNEITKMKSYVVQEKWEFLDNWSKTHVPISEKCLYPWDADFQNTMIFGGNDVGGSSSVTLFYTFDCPEYSYWFDLTELELELIDGKWQIVSWKEICEERGSGRRCFR
jgi:hypothetical protein